MAAHVPRRRCVGCGRVASKPELVRFAATPSGAGGWLAMRDLEGKLPGRGAYVCRLGADDRLDNDCLRLAVKKGGLRRTLRRPVELPTDLDSAVSLESEYR
ncbi:MAG: YlxR family protein [Solirubrobacteraceae bacterium]